MWWSGATSAERTTGSTRPAATARIRAPSLFTIADSLYSGADVSNLAADPAGASLKITLYGSLNPVPPRRADRLHFQR